MSDIILFKVVLRNNLRIHSEILRVYHLTECLFSPPFSIGIRLFDRVEVWNPFTCGQYFHDVSSLFLVPIL
jgi:hypothetical protein